MKQELTTEKQESKKIGRIVLRSRAMKKVGETTLLDPAPTVAKEMENPSSAIKIIGGMGHLSCSVLSNENIGSSEEIGLSVVVEELDNQERAENMKPRKLSNAIHAEVGYALSDKPIIEDVKEDEHDDKEGDDYPGGNFPALFPLRGDGLLNVPNVGGNVGVLFCVPLPSKTPCATAKQVTLALLRPELFDILTPVIYAIWLYRHIAENVLTTILPDMPNGCSEDDAPRRVISLPVVDGSGRSGERTMEVHLEGSGFGKSKILPVSIVLPGVEHVAQFWTDNLDMWLKAGVEGLIAGTFYMDNVRFISTIWVIWKGRCKLVLHNEISPPLQLARWVVSVSKDTNVAFMKDFRGVRKGLRLAKRRGFRDVELEVDSLVLADLLRGEVDYSPPNKFFINSGSSSNITLNGRNFIGDIKSYSIFSITKSNHVSNTNNSSELYQTARFNKSPFAYKFQIDQNGTYFLRLHFYPFSSSTNLFSALFNVSTSKSSLLSCFSVSTSNNLPIIKEFLLNMSVAEFQILFTPSGNSSLAFVNAIEVFIAPDNFVQDEAPFVTSFGANNNFQGLQSHVLQTVHKINVGGDKVTPDNDTLWRTWIPDDDFLYHRDAAKSFYYDISPNYQSGESSEYIAPALVYETGQEMNIDSSWKTNNFNITWIFNVSKSSTHYVRFHFCDFISLSPDVLQFNLFIYSNFSKKIDPYAVFSQLAVPFYCDFVVVSDGSGLMNISIGPRSDSMNKTAFLNGVEIWELVTGPGSTTIENGSRKSPSIVIICSVVGGSFVILIIAVVAMLRLKRKAKPVGTLEWPWVSPYRGSSHSDGSASIANIPNINLGLKIPFADILAVTNNFNPELLIGEGGFGKVYKGKYQNMEVEVKRSQPGYKQGLTEFQAEIRVLSKIRHRHLLPLIGYCDDRYEMILVDEFMEKGQIGEIVDPLLAGKIAPSSLRKFGETVEKCLRETGAERSSMDVVQWDLVYALKLQQTSTGREAHEDSTINISLNLPLLAIQRLPSQSIVGVEDNSPSVIEDFSEINASAVFSQLRMGGER
ncbi:Serine-threonine/tyrosine-protein kinase, catalytic domain [Dillenia turbinata]|uniref:Serine-threonine/tyrosine-protein kinase, catalytic domain n=1 Tax=Dillenia turbinata TaxID=194707 RepID=A0AAN8Z836_9MAGN